jgi:tRNA (guanine37-N1)-methyltransferase
VKCDILTLFPQFIYPYIEDSIIKRARQKGLVEIEVYDIRDFTTDKHRAVDDYVYGGGGGMLLKPEPLFRAIEFLKQKTQEPTTVIYVTPQGRQYNQRLAEELATKKERFIFICGRYEGIDERVRTALVDDEISIGDYVLTGGELPVLVVIDSVVRLIKGALGNEASAENESFTSGLLDFPHYTRPEIFRGLKTPETLLSGHHQHIQEWRNEQAYQRTLQRRPDLITQKTNELND